jgi:hypothetical protein
LDRTSGGALFNLTIMQEITITPEIRKACEAWIKAETAAPEKQYDPGFIKGQANARRAWTRYSKLCRAAGLNPVSTVRQIRETKTLKG